MLINTDGKVYLFIFGSVDYNKSGESGEIIVNNFVVLQNY